MKPLREIKPEMPENGALFDGPFYQRFNVSPFTLELNDEITKTYMFPTFYGNVTNSVAIYFCSWEKAKSMMPDPGMVPVRMGKGRSIVVFSCYEYKKVHQVVGYNEIAMTIPVMVGGGMKPPVLPMIMSGLFSSFGYYVFSMPVTSLENRIRGNKIWGLPKVTQEIGFEQKDGFHICSAFEENGEPYFRLKVPMNGKPALLDETGYLYSKLDGDLLKSKTCFTGTFKINKYMKRLISSEPVENDFLWVGDTPSGQMVKELELDTHPFQFRYAEKVSSCFDLPEERL